MYVLSWAHLSSLFPFHFNTSENFLKIFIFLFFLVSSIFAQENYSIRLAYGKSTESDLGEILIGQVNGDVADLRTFSLDGGYLLGRDLFHAPVDLYIKSSLSYFDEAGLQDDIYEVTLYFKLYYNFTPYSQKVRFGFGEGASYTDGILMSEYYGALEHHDHTSHYLNYLDITLDIDMGTLLQSKMLHHTYIGFLIKHRSGIFGLINNVKHGGSNYNCVMIEKNF